MKFNSIFTVTFAVIVVIAAISAIFLISQFSEKTADDSDFVTDDSNSSANDVKIDSVSKPEIEHSRKLDEFSVSANSNLTKFENLVHSFGENRITMPEFIRDLGEIIENIEEIDSKYSGDVDIVKTAQYADFADLRMQVRQTFYARYSLFLNDTIEFYCFWWEIDKAQKFVSDEKSDAGRYIPALLQKAPELISIFKNADEKIAETAEELKEISDEVKRFVVNTLATVNEIESAETTDKAGLKEKISDWHNSFSMLMPKIQEFELIALIPRVKKAFYALEIAYFTNADTMKNDADVDFAVKYFPFSLQLFQQIQEKFDKKYSKDTRLQNKGFTVYEIFRQRFYNGFGLMNSTLFLSMNDASFNEMLLFVDYLVFFTNHFAKDQANKELLSLVNQWIASITSTVEQSLKLTTKKDVAQNVRYIRYCHIYLSVLLRIKHVNEIESISENVDEIEKKQSVLKSVLSMMATHKSHSFYQVVKLLTDSVAYNKSEITEILHQAVIVKVKSEFDSILKINDEGQKNAAFAEMFAEIDELFSMLNYLKYPSRYNLNTAIAKIIKPVSQKDVITAIIIDEKSKNAVIAKLEKSTNLVFVGFITDIYNRLLLTRKGDEDVDKAFVDENLLTLTAYSKAYTKLADCLKTKESNTFTNAYIFCKNYNKISKFSFVDQFLKDKHYFRTTLINSLSSKYDNQLSVLNSFESLRTLESIYNFISETFSWSELNTLKKIKSQIVNLIFKNSKNYLIYSGTLLAEEFLESKFFDILLENWEVLSNEIWLDYAKWFSRNFSLNPSHKNIIDEKIKTLINK